MDKARELDLVRQAQQGDRDSYGRLADLYGGSLLAIAYSHVGDFATSQDISQDALVLAFERLSQLRRPQDFGAWLRTIARNLCHRWHRNQAYRRRLREDCAALRERLGIEATPSAADSLGQRETTAILDETLNHLPPHEREALVLFYFEGKSVNEAAYAAGISPVAMRKRIQRARDGLRQALDAQVEAGLVHVARRRKMSALVLAAAPAGTSLGKVANATSAVPSSLSMAFQAIVVSAPAKVALTATAAVLVAGTFFTALHARQADLSAAPVAPALAQNASDELTEPSAGYEAWRPTAATAIAVKQEAANTASIQGVVRGPDGQPIANAKVEAIQRSTCGDVTEMERHVLAEATTDGEGAYCLAQLPATEERPMVFATHAQWANGGLTIEALKEGEHREGVDITLAPPSAVTGVVVDSHGAPVAGASVFLRAVQHQTCFEGNDGPRVNARWYGCFARAKAGGDGVFTLEHLPQGWIMSQLGAFAPGYAVDYAYSHASHDKAQRLMRSGASSLWSACDIVPGTEDIRIVLTRGAVVTGCVVLAPGGEPVAGAEIAIEGNINSSGMEYADMSFERLATSGADGRFRIADLPEGELRFSVENGDLMAPPRMLTMAPGKAVDAGTFELTPTGAFEGVVYDANSGQPIPDFEVAYQPVGVYGSFSSAKTDAQGHYRAERVPACDWRVWPMLNGEWELAPQRHTFTPPDDHIVVRIKSGEKANGVDLYCVEISHPEGNIRGRITAANGLPVAGATVRFGGTREATSEGDGRYAAQSLDAGMCNFVAVDPATQRYGTASVEIPADGEAVADIRLDGLTGRITGSVTDADGNATQAPIRLRFVPEGFPAFEVRTDEQGAFLADGLIPAHYRVMLAAPPKGYRTDPLTCEITLGEGAQETVDLKLIAMVGFVAGTATFADGRPAANMSVGVGSSHAYVRGQTDGEGRFRIEPVDGENLYVQVGDSSSPVPWARVCHVQLNSEALQIVVREPGVLKGYAVPVEGDPQMPSVNTASSDFSVFRNTEDGTFSIALQPGTYNVTVRTSTRSREFRDIAIASGMETDLGTIELAGGTCAIVGNVSLVGLAADAPQPSIMLEARAIEQDSASVHSPTSRATGGAYRLEGLYPGQYIVIGEVICEGAVRPIFQPVEVKDGAEARADFAIEFGDAAITGTIALPATEAAKPSFPVYVFKPGTCPFVEGTRPADQAFAGDIVAMAMATPGGAFTCSGLQAGSYDIAAAIPGGDGSIARSDVQRITVAAGGQASVSLDLASH